MMNPITDRLNPDHVVKTVEILHRRIEERFPGSKLSAVCGGLVDVARQSKDRAEWIQRPNLFLQAFGLLVGGVLLFAAYQIAITARMPEAQLDALQLAQLVESAINDLLFLFAIGFFCFTFEVRLKRRKALRAIHELRMMAHLIDMHQLTKDPDRVLRRGPGTPSSPDIGIASVFELSRYLDYCSEMLSLTAKLAALYIKNYDDAVVLAAVNEVEQLSSGISNKVWQKLMILHAFGDRVTAGAAPRS